MKRDSQPLAAVFKCIVAVAVVFPETSEACHGIRQWCGKEIIIRMCVYIVEIAKFVANGLFNIGPILSCVVVEFVCVEYNKNQ